MAGKPNLSVVTEQTAPPKRKVHAKIADALEGSGRDVLASMRKALAKRLDDGDVSSNAIASAYKELRELDRLIRAIDAADQEEGGQRGSTGDETWEAI